MLKIYQAPKWYGDRCDDRLGTAIANDRYGIQRLLLLDFFKGTGDRAGMDDECRVMVFANE